MLHDIPAETIYSQIGELAGQLSDEASEVVRAACGPRPGEQDDAGRAKAVDAAPAPFLVVGAVRRVGRVQGKVLLTQVPTRPIPGAEPLRDAFHDTIEPFLGRPSVAATALGVRARAAQFFEDLRTRVPPEAHPAVDALEGMCEQRRQWDEQARLHRRLHGWLWVHFPLSVALVVLMALHAWAALKYW
jgi:hypothetical protein